ncbi:uncharacterized protein BDZ99DRAFT_507581 [Mytilinidion resinicola]|uniref:Uncharacterized protein n=1 Tax=Mytilinidion resinicola TaxID=574789 RepID=A0A6A6YTJ2_9PEZI|nr:uncharacterized protein BDZ99DRAFT_507581 [Mytilinidion resinicola]KAF2812242.1 hypothetical protein BDZ99DRAFT_507581 [Mytilinidion resinicola]
MGSQGHPPPHVSPYLIPAHDLLLQIGGFCWTLCYILSIRAASRNKTYSMPLFALANNLAWEAVYGLFVAEQLLERLVFTIWLVLDIPLAYAVVVAEFGEDSCGMIVLAAWGHYAFATWWVKERVGGGRGKRYPGDLEADMTELAYWSVGANQVHGSVAALVQLAIRGHSGGVGWGIWASRTIGSVVGAEAVWVSGWYFWPEGFPYVFNPFGVFIWATALACDLAYPILLWRIRKTERMLSDGSKASGEIQKPTGKKMR